MLEGRQKNLNTLLLQFTRSNWTSNESGLTRSSEMSGGNELANYDLAIFNESSYLAIWKISSMSPWESPMSLRQIKIVKLVTWKMSPNDLRLSRLIMWNINVPHWMWTFGSVKALTSLLHVVPAFCVLLLLLLILFSQNLAWPLKALFLLHPIPRQRHYVYFIALEMIKRWFLFPFSHLSFCLGS